jgi:PAS domain S-box-containing protein
MQPSTYIALMLLTAALALALALYIVRRRSAPGAMALVVLTLAAAVWSAAYAFELAGPDLETKLSWTKIEYLGIVAVAPAWFVFASQYADRARWLTDRRRNLALLAVVPTITLIVTWTNEAHGLIWSRTGLTTSGPLLLLDVDYGPWFWVHSAYSYSLLLIGSIWLIVMIRQTARLYYLQAGVALLGMLAPWIANVLFLSRLGPWPDLDLTPLGFALGGLAYAWCLFRLRLLDIVPIARRAVVDGLGDGVIVLDAHDRIVEANPAAQRLAGSSDVEMIGRPAAQALGACAPLAAQLRELNGARTEMTLGLGEGSAQQYYDVQISPLANRRGDPVGRLVVMHDVTHRKQAEEALRQQNEYLAALHETTLGLIERLDLTGLLHTIVDRAASLMDTPHGFLYVADPTGTEMDLRVGTGLFAGTAGSRLRRGERNDWSNHIAELSRLRAVASIPLRAGSEVIGIIGLAYSEAGRVFTAGQIDRLSRFGRLAALALHNARLYAAAQEELYERRRVEAELQQAKDELETRVVERTAELHQLNEELLVELARRMRAEVELQNLAGRLALIREEEKASIARAVHDELGQMLTALKMDVAWLSKRLPEHDDKLLQKASAMSESISMTIRSVQRISAELRPGLLDTLGLAAALEWQAQEFQARTDIDCRVDLDVDEEALLRLNPDVTTALFRIAQESLTNVARHAQATAVHIRLARQANRMSLIVRDNGKGIAPAEVAAPKSLGLIGMRERLRPWQGELKIEGRPGEGTTVIVSVPL